MILSKKQVNLLNEITKENSPEIYVLGSVQSGKTYVIALGIIMYAAKLHEYKPDEKYFGAIIGWDLQTVKKNIVTPLKEFLDQMGYRSGKDYELKYGIGEQSFRIWNMTYYFLGFNTVDSFNKILGNPLIYEWVDESAKIYSKKTLQESFDQLPGRTVSYAGHPYKKVIHSFNVEGNNHHPYKEKYIDGKPGAVHFTFYPIDNPKIDTKEKYQEVIDTFPPGSLREQKIFNKWVVAEGRVFNTINKLPNLEGLIISEIGIGVDYGNVNPTTFVPVALCFKPDEKRYILVRLGVYYHRSGENNEKPTTAWYVEQEKQFIKYLNNLYPNIPVTCNVVDSEAIHYTNALYNAGIDYTLANKGNGSVDEGVQQMQSLFYKNVLYVLEEKSIDKFEGQPIYQMQDESLVELESYQYDIMKSQSTGQNCYRKEQDHSIDALRYLITYWQEIGKCPII